MKARPMPLDLRQVEADLSLGPGVFELRASRARWGDEGEVEASARGSWNEDELDAHASITANNFVFCQELIEGMPRPLAAILDKLAPKGDFDAYLPNVRIRGGAQRAWSFEGRIPFRNTSLQIGLDLTELEGALYGTCTVAPNGESRIDAEFELQRGHIAGRSLEGWKGQLRWLPQDGLVRLIDIHGRLCDGEAVGAVTIDPKTGDYEVSLALRDVSAKDLFPAPGDDPERQRRGRLDGRVHLRGKANDPGSRMGGGDVRISGVSFLNTPVLASVAKAGGPEEQPLDGTVDQADLRFLWEGSLLRLLRVEIRSPSVRMIGEGKWNMLDDTIEMTLVGAHPKDWQRVPLLTDIVETAGQQLVKYEVRGPLHAPEVTVKPLYHIDEALRALLGQPQ
jgi:hypothetical protein